MATEVEVHEDETPATDTTVTVVDVPEGNDDTATLVTIGTAVGRLETAVATIAGTLSGVVERLDAVELTASNAQDTAYRAEGEAVEAQATAETAVEVAVEESEAADETPEEPPKMHWLDRPFRRSR